MHHSNGNHRVSDDEFTYICCMMQRHYAGVKPRSTNVFGAVRGQNSCTHVLKKCPFVSKNTGVATIAHFLIEAEVGGKSPSLVWWRCHGVWCFVNREFKAHTHRPLRGNISI